MKRRRSIGDTIFVLCNTLFLLFMAVIMLYPLWYVAMASLSNSAHLMSHEGLLLLPLDFNIESYRMVAKNPNIITGYANTLLITGAGTIFNVLFTAMGAYVMSRKPFPFKKFFMIMMVITMYISGGMIPSYILNNNWLHLGDNRLVLILPGLVTTYNLVIMRSGLEAVPDSLEESAKIDGASEFQVLFRIMLPVALPALAVITLYYAVSHWNSWFAASIYLRDSSKYPLQLILRSILINNSTGSMTEGVEGDQMAIAESIKYATIMVATIPILLVYPFVQKYFVKGAMIGAVKG